MAVWSKALLLTASCLSSLFKSHLGMWKSCQWLGIRQWFSPDTPVSSTSYNWLVTTWPQYSRKKVEFFFSKFQLFSTFSTVSTCRKTLTSPQRHVNSLCWWVTDRGARRPWWDLYQRPPIKPTMMSSQMVSRVPPPYYLGMGISSILKHNWNTILYNWYFLHAFKICYFRAPHDSVKITSFR